MRTNNSAVTWSAAATKSLAASANSDAFPVKNMTAGAVQIVVSGASSLNGTIKLQASCDDGTTSISNWVDVSGASGTLNADGASMWNLTSIGYRWIRLVWTRVGGSGTVAVTVQVKGVD